MFHVEHFTMFAVLALGDKMPSIGLLFHVEQLEKISEMGY
jgi:hypothetical protein